MGLISITGLITLWFLGLASHGLFQYWRLDAKTPVQEVHWSVQSLSSTHFGMEGEYAYEVNGRHYQGKTFFKTPVYLNAYAAEKDRPKWEGHTWEVWYQSRHPQNSSLQKLFPTKAIIHGAIALGIFLYFFFVKEILLRKR